MFIIAGLGNPGAKYAGNRHNIGFMAIDEIARQYGASPWRSKFNADCADVVIDTAAGPKKALLLKPTTFMNESGRSVSAAAKFYKIGVENIVAFHDELDLDPGKFRIKRGGGIAGHNGLRSIRQHMNAEFVRGRMGIGHPGHKDRVHSYVLSDFAKSEQQWVEDQCDAIARALPLLLETDMDMDRLNTFQTKVTLLAPAPSKVKKG